MDRSRRLKKTLVIEQARLDKLVTQHINFREQLQPYHSGHGWETEAFISQTGILHSQPCIPDISLGTIAGTISVGQIPQILENWIIPLDIVSLQKGKPIETLQKTIQKGLNQLNLKNKLELNCDEFVLLCEYIVGCWEKE